MSERTTNQAAHSAQSFLEAIERDLQELKSRQPIARALQSKTFISATALPFDVSAYAVPANTIMYFYFTVNCDGSQARPYGIQYSDVYNGGTAPGNRLSDYQATDASGVLYASYINADTITVGTVGFIIAVTTGATAASIYIKFRAIVSSKSVSMSWFAST